MNIPPLESRIWNILANKVNNPKICVEVIGRKATIGKINGFILIPPLVFDPELRPKGGRTD